jgi:hypothetical protein
VIHEHRHLLDWLVWISGGVAALNFNTVLGTVALCISIALGVIRIHDRFRYGPAKGRGE